ncbi:MAG TPA: hypothetical protein P5299_01095 [Candidatus Woesebacteria bacterium]|nr:hypothetical protein [Candidatus Woesebacteria bacterium]HRT39947.1 hypothetical protein [Candidatus Woesebacteria bacterium]
MKKKNNFFFLFLSEILILFILLFIIPAIFLNRFYESNESGDYEFIPLANGKIIEENLKTTHFNLEQISLLFKNPNFKSDQSIFIEINQNSLALTGHSVGDPSWVPFKFPPTNGQINLKIYSPTTPKDLIYLGINQKDKSIATKSVYRIIGFKNRFIANSTFQINRLKNNFTPIIIYGLIILILDCFYVKKK